MCTLTHTQAVFFLKDKSPHAYVYCPLLLRLGQGEQIPLQLLAKIKDGRP